MISEPKSPKEIVNEALEAFDLVFSEIVSEYKHRLDLIVKQNGFETDAHRLNEELRQVKYERNGLGKKLSDRAIADRLTGRLKNVRKRIENLLDKINF